MSHTPVVAHSAQAWHRARKTVEMIGTTGLVVLLLGAGFSKAAQNIGMALALVAFLVGLSITHRQQWWPVVSRDWLFRLTLLWVAYVVVLAMVMARVYPEAAADHYDFAWKLSRLFLIVLVGWWTHISFKTPLSAYWLVLGGVGIGLLAFHHELGWPVIGLEGRRLEFWENAQFYGVLTGSTLLLLGFLAVAFIGPRHHWGFFPRLLLWLLLLAMTLNAFLLSEARGATLGLLAVLLVMALTVAASWTRSLRITPKKGLLLLSVILMMVSLPWLFPDQVQHRMAVDIAAVQESIENPEEIPVTSMGVRIYQWHAAAPLVLEHPWFGWGPGAGSYLHEQVQLPAQYRSGGSHFHNSWLDLLLWTGLAGCLVFLSFLVLWGKAVLTTIKESHTYSTLAFGAGAVLILFVVAALTQTYLTSQAAWFYLAAFLGPVTALRFKFATGNSTSMTKTNNLEPMAHQPNTLSHLHTQADPIELP